MGAHSLISSSENLSSNLWVPNSFELTLDHLFRYFKSLCLSLLFCQVSCWRCASIRCSLGTVTVTTTSLAYTTVTESLVTQSLCISSGTDPCRRKRGMLYENPFLTFDDGTGQAPQYIFNGFRIVPVSLLPRIDADPIGFENLENFAQENNHFLSGASHIETSMQDISARNAGSDPATPRIFNTLVSSIINFSTVTTTVSVTVATTKTSFSTSSVSIRAKCVPISYTTC